MKFLIYSLLALSPLPLASVRPSWQWLWVLTVGVITIAFLIKSIRGHEIQWPKAITLPAALVFLCVIWGFIQAYVPIDQSIIVSSLPAFETISVNPALTINNVLYFLTHLLLFFGVYAFCSRRDKAVNLVKVIGVTVGF